MSDDFLRIVPTAPDWVPAEADADAAASVVEGLCPAGGALEIHWHDEIVFVDQGANFEQVRCPSCGADLAMPWWLDQMNRVAATRFTDLATTTPCCATRTSLNDLDYVWPAAFARFEVEVRNPGRGWLLPDELARVAAALHHPVRQVFTHY